MTEDVLCWAIVGFLVGMIWMLLVEAIVRGIDERRTHRKVIEHEARMTRYAAEASSPRALP